MKIPITKAVLDEREKEALIEPLESGWLVQGPKVAQFEKLFAAYTQMPYAIAVANCTAALHIALEALKIGRGDKVIVPSFTYVASANAVLYTGAEVLFCDIDLNTFNIDVQHCADLLTKNNNIKAIMPVHLFGLCADMPAILSLVEETQLAVIEDAACAYDAWIYDQHAGTFGTCGCFSFHPRKALTTGEGGMIITRDATLAQTLVQLKDHGACKSDLARHMEKGGSLLPDFTMRGFNYRMTDLQGALGVTQMQKASWIMQARRKIAERYDAFLKDYPTLITPKVPAHYRHAYQSYVCLFAGDEDLTYLTQAKIDRLNKERNRFMEKLESQGIATRQGTHAVHTLSYYRDRYHLKAADFLKSYAADRLSIALPLYATMSDQEFDYVTEHLHKALSACAASVV